MNEKEIIVTNLTSKVITPKPGATWKAFTVYMIQGNDGITYETTFQDFFNSLKIGQAVKIKFKIDTKTSNGKVYTSYKLDLPKKSDPAIAELKVEIMSKLDMMEKNIISAMRMICQPKGSKPEKKEAEQLSLFPDDDRTAFAEPDDLPEEDPELGY